MQEFRVTVTESAVQDLRDLREYLSNQFGERIAIKSIQELIELYSSLAEFPYKGKSAVEVINLLEAYYYLLTRQNIVFYSINVDQQSILIHRIFTTKEDFVQKLLGYVNDGQN